MYFIPEESYSSTRLLDKVMLRVESRHSKYCSLSPPTITLSIEFQALIDRA